MSAPNSSRVHACALAYERKLCMHKHFSLLRCIGSSASHLHLCEWRECFRSFALSLLLSTFFSQAKIASVVAPIIFFALVLPKYAFSSCT